MSIFGLCASGNFVVVNRTVLKQVGMTAAMMLAELADEEKFYEESGRLDNGWFFSTVQNIEDRTGIKKDQQLSGIRTLEKHGIVECEKRGMPAKRYFRLIPEGLQKMFTSQPVGENADDKLAVNPPQVGGNADNKKEENPPTVGGKPAIQSAENPPLRITPFKENKTKKIKIINKDCLDVINYLNEKTGRRYKATENYNRLINGRKSEGHTVEEMKQVIDIKCEEWSGTDMEKFLRPSTLFAPSHFEDYLNQKPAKKKSSLFEGVDLSAFEGEWKQ